MSRIALLIALLLTVRLSAQSPLPEPRVEEAGSGIWVIHNPRANETWPQGNTVVIAGSTAVLVVDAGYLPATTRVDLAIIRRLTPLPVRYLVNTHWHNDHTNGNSAYRDAFPDVRVIGHPDSRRLMADNLMKYAASILAPDSPQRALILSLRQRIDSLQKHRDTTGLANLQLRLAQRELEQREIGALRVVLPDLLVPDALTIDLGDRTVEIAHFGRGNTPGDLTVRVPSAGVIAVGDLVVSPMPYAYNSFPTPWIRVLDALLAQRNAVIVPGHGDIQRDVSYVQALRAMLAEVVDKTREAFRAGKTADDARARIDFAPYRKRFAGDDPFLTAVFRSSIEIALVDRAFLEASGGS